MNGLDIVVEELRTDMKVIMTKQMPDIVRALTSLTSDSTKHCRDIESVKASLASINDAIVQMKMDMNTANVCAQRTTDRVDRLESNRSMWLDRVLTVIQTITIGIVMWMIQNILRNYTGGLP